MAIVIILLFIIAMAVAPEAMINICRSIEWLAKGIGIVVAFAACVFFFATCLGSIAARFL